MTCGRVFDDDARAGNQYARAMADLFKPMTTAFVDLWLDGKPAENSEYWQRDIGEFKLDEVRQREGPDLI